MDWFTRLTGFAETDYEGTRAKLEVEGDRLRSRVNGASHGIGTLELASLAELRERATTLPVRSGRSSIGIVQGDVRRMHHMPEHAGALFQVASQFNLLEMVGPSVTPEDGVARYAGDPTQGPACAIAAGAATIYRNYFAPVGGHAGQTAARQLDGLADLGAALAVALGLPVDRLWTMRNGYALCTATGLDAIARHLQGLAPDDLDRLRRRLRIGLHRDVEVTDAPAAPRPFVSQAFCSALPVAYGKLPPARWEAFARLVLEAAYEATLLAAALNAARGASSLVFLTLLGGGAFGNETGWILDAMRRAVALTSELGLDVRIVSYGAPSRQLAALVADAG